MRSRLAVVLLRALRQAALLLLLALVPAAVSAALQLRWHAGEKLAPDEVTPAQARQWEGVLFVDARSRARFAAGHIPGAFLLNEEEWDALSSKFLDAWEPGGRVVVYCDGGGCEASRSVAERLKRDFQLTNVFVLKGGWPAWHEHG